MIATSPIEDLFSLTLHDGLPVTTEGKEIKYRQVKLRETRVADERAAQRAAERMVMVDGAPRLLVSDAEFRYALTARHIDAFMCDGQAIPGAMVDVDLLGKLSSHDLGLIERRVFLINLAAELRYGNISQGEFDALSSGEASGSQGPRSPQPVGQAAGQRADAADDQSGPALLADFAGGAAAGAPAVHGR